VGKGLNAKDIHKEMFPVYGGKCLVHNYVGNFSQGRSKVADDAPSVVEVAETAVKDLHAEGFDALVRQWDKCFNVGAGYGEKHNFFQVQISHVLRFTSICGLFTDFPSYIMKRRKY
jgi:hypothetical protein